MTTCRSSPQDFRIGRTALCAILLAAITAISIRTSAQKANAAQQAAPKDESETVRFSLHPAKAPYAALQYRLLPTGMETTAGNAAQNYFRAILVWDNDASYQSATSETNPTGKAKLVEWLKLPLDKLAKNQEAQKFFNDVPTGNWDLIDLAARCDHCDWELPVREMNISTPIPELVKLRGLARLLQFKARIEIARGQVENAVATLKTGFALAHHTGQAPTLINFLVGEAISRMMLDQVAELIQRPDCPNLYWTLTALPHPIVDSRAALEFEGHFVYLALPELREIRTAVHTNAEWDRMLYDVVRRLNKMMPVVDDSMKPLQAFAETTALAVMSYPKRNTQLAEAGYTPAEIKAMSTSQAIMTAEVVTFEHLTSESYKWFNTNPPEALKGLHDAQDRLLHLDQSHQEFIPLARLLLPALTSVKVKEVAVDRQVAALRVVEAIRLYAAENNAKLPSTLAEIKTVPLPDDPTTGKPFAYELTDGAAVITSPSPLKEYPASGMRFEIRLATKK